MVSVFRRCVQKGTQTAPRSQGTLWQVCKGKHQLYVSSSGSTITAELKPRFHEPRPNMSMQNRPMTLLTTEAFLAFIGVEVAKFLSTKGENRLVTRGLITDAMHPLGNLVVHTMNLQCLRSCRSEVRSVKKITRSQNTQKSTALIEIEQRQWTMDIHVRSFTSKCDITLVRVLQWKGGCVWSRVVVSFTTGDPSVASGPQASSYILTLPRIVVYKLTACVRSVSPSSSVKYVRLVRATGGVHRVWWLFCWFRLKFIFIVTV
jgi:hypothetical protein